MTPLAAAPASPRPLVFGAAAALLLVLFLWALRGLVVLVAFAVLLAYALDPLVGALQRVHLPRRPPPSRRFAAAVVVLVLFALVGWLLSLAVPRLVSELGDFARGLPRNLETVLAWARETAARQGLTGYIDPALDQLRASLPGLLQSLGGLTARWLGVVFGSLAQLLGFAMLPLLSFYLLAEREAVQASVLGFLPEHAHPRLMAATAAIDRALRSYVRGQAIVCLVMGVAVGGVLAVLGFPGALLLGAAVGFAEILPYLGFALAAIAIGIAGFGMSPWHALLGIAVYALANNLIGLLVTPRVMGRHLKMHPFVVTVSILAGAELLGPAGALLALPAAAVIQSLVSEFGPRPGPRGGTP